jgi:hypothetical protein
LCDILQYVSAQPLDFLARTKNPLFPVRKPYSSLSGLSGRTLVGKGPTMSLIDNPEHAKRLARAIISDVAIYNREKVEQGIKNDSIFDLLEVELDEGRQHFISRVSPEMAASNIFDLAIVDVLIKRAGKIDSTIW